MAYQTFLSAKAAQEATNRNRTEDAYVGQQRNALMGAGQQFAAGDISGASNALAGAGMLDDALAVGRYGTAQTTAAEDRRFDAIAAVAQGLRRLPAEQRWQAYQSQGLAGLRAHGVGDDIITQITPEMMDDGQLELVISAYGGEVQDPSYQNVGGGRIVQTDPYGGPITEAYVAPRDPLDDEYRRAQIDAQKALVPQRQASAEAAQARAARSRAGPAPRSGGSSGGSSRPAAPSGPQTGGALPPGFTIRRR